MQTKSLLTAPISESSTIQRSRELSHQTQFRARVVFLGASNVMRGLSTIVETLRLMLGSPLEILAAIGHGRSFGTNSTVHFVRTLPSILDCGLWNALAESKGDRPDQPTFALITDIGNDVMYGKSPLTIAGWVEQSIERLQDHGAQIAMTMLPIESIRKVRRWQYRFVKTMMFPTRRLSYEDALLKADELHELLVELAMRRGVRMIECDRSWYGFDPIHIHPSQAPGAWSAILCSCLAAGDGASTKARMSLRRWIRLRAMTPQRWWLAGVPLGRPQPAGQLADGTTISLF